MTFHQPTYDENNQAEQDPLAILKDFAADPPDSGHWVYEGYGSGGHVLACSDSFEYHGSTVVRFHVHRADGTPGWAFGSMWVEGIDNTAVNLNEEGNRGVLTGVVNTYFGQFTAE